MLSFDAPPTLSGDSFLAACREQLGETDASVVEALLTGTPSEHLFVAAWRDKDTILRNAVARQRARHAHGADASRWLRPTVGCDTQIESLVEDAFQEGNPLAKEKALDRVRWQVADDLQGPDPLTVRVIFSYAIKLSLLSRWQTLGLEQGRVAFDQLSHVPITLNTEL
jgi:hypothetical protein